ncbi:MAG: calcium-binding protein, partial [Caldilinea sp.]
MPSTLNLMTTRRSAIVRRVALILAVPLIATLMLGVGVALAGRHYGGNGPDGTPNPLSNHGNCAPYLFGRVYVNGVAVGNAHITLYYQYLTQTLTTTTGSQLYIGTVGADGPVAGTSAADGMYGNAGNDTLTAAEGANFVQGNAGDDSITAGSSADILYGGQGHDQITSGGGNNFVQG